MLVSFFSRVMFTSMSSAREFSPTTMPSYTSSPGWTKNVIRSCSAIIANGVTTPERSATIEPRSRATMGPAQLSYPENRALAMPVPRVADRNSVRKPIRPRLGTANSMRTHPVPWFAMDSIRPRRAASSCVIAPRYSSGASMVSCSNGSCRRPSGPMRVTTWGFPTVSSNPSRRMFSTRIASASSPRPCTSHASGRPMSTTRSDTLPMSSRSSRSLTMRAVSL